MDSNSYRWMYFIKISLICLTLIAVCVKAVFEIRKHFEEEDIDNEKIKDQELKIEKIQNKIKELELKGVKRDKEQKKFNATLSGIYSKKIEYKRLKKELKKLKKQIEIRERNTGNYTVINEKMSNEDVLSFDELQKISSMEEAYYNVFNLYGSKYIISNRRYIRTRNSCNLNSFDNLLLETLHPAIARMLTMVKSIEREVITIGDEVFSYVSYAVIQDSVFGGVTPFEEFLQSIGYAKYSIIWDEKTREYLECILITHEFFVHLFELIAEHGMSNGIDFDSMTDDDCGTTLIGG